MKYSIVIPTYNHCEDLLRPCIESIKQYTDLSNVEVIVVANGCTDNTREYVESLGDPFKLVWYPGQLGYTIATNLGICVSKGEYVVLLNNDTMLLPQNTNDWLSMLEMPFHRNPNIGLVGPLINRDPNSQREFIVFFCVMIAKKVFDKIGILDPIFSPGYGEDTDFTLRAQDAGFDFAAPGDYRVVEYEENGVKKYQNVGAYPIWHRNNQTFGQDDTYRHAIEKNNRILTERYRKTNP